MNPLFFIPFNINDIQPATKPKFYKMRKIEKAPKVVCIAKRYSGHLR